MRKLTGKKARNRRILGIVSIVIMVVGIFSLNQQADPEGYQNRFDEIASMIVYVWFLFSFINKLLMIFNRQSNTIVFASLLLFLIMTVVAMSITETTTPFQTPVIYVIYAPLVIIWILGWLIIDAIDLRHGF